MGAELYVLATVARHRVAESRESTPERVRRRLEPLIREWGEGHVESVRVSGSYAKGTAVRNRSMLPNDVDVDLLVSLSPEMPGTLAEAHASLERFFQAFLPRPGNVSLRILHEGVNVDLVPGRRRRESGDHTLWQLRRGTWLRTNVEEQIRHVRESGTANDVVALKIWRRRHALAFPSVCLELAAIRALEGRRGGPADERLLAVLRFLAGEFPETALRDPANASNVVSDVMSEEEKRRVAGAAEWSLGAARWEDVL